MEYQNSIGDLIRLARQQKNLSQAELAFKCNLHLRTIQRIERNYVVPRPYTLRILEEILETKLVNEQNANKEREQFSEYRLIFKKRKRIRLVTFFFAIFLLMTAFLFIISGISKVYWAPFIYVFFFADFIVIGLTWRCPGCNSLLGDVFNVKYCSKCGLKLYQFEDEIPL